MGQFFLMLSTVLYSSTCIQPIPSCVLPFNTITVALWLPQFDGIQASFSSLHYPLAYQLCSQSQYYIYYNVPAVRFPVFWACLPACSGYYFCLQPHMRNERCQFALHADLKASCKYTGCCRAAKAHNITPPAQTSPPKDIINPVPSSL